MRRDIWFETNDWKMLLNQAVMDFCGETHLLERDFEITLAEGAVEYDLSEERIYRLTEDGVYALYDSDNDTWSYTDVLRASRATLRDEIGADWYTTTGAPQYVYPIQNFTLGIYPVPSADEDGQKVYIHGNYYPEEIISSTPDTTELPFEHVDHPTIVMGVLVLANRIDKSIVLSRDIAESYTRGILAARSRKMARMGTGSKMVTHGR